MNTLLVLPAPICLLCASLSLMQVLPHRWCAGLGGCSLWSDCPLLKNAKSTTTLPRHCCYCLPSLPSLCRFRHAGGVEDWAVQCCCGVRDDDGERMTVCDSCGFWVHTRCNGVRDQEEEPPSGFACKPCREAAAAAAAAAAKPEAGGGAAAAGGKRAREGTPQ
jgi:hypothetical protein